MANFVQSSFLGGEWSQTAQGNFTKPDYRAAMDTCLNGLPLEPGAWTRRPGTTVAAFTRGGGKGRVIKWDFQNNAPYTVEFTDGYLRFYAGTTLVTDTDTQSVSAISTANPAVVQTAGSHGWVTGQQFVFQNLSVIDPYLLNRTFIGTVTDSTHLSLADAVTGTTLNGSLLQAFGTGTIARVTEFQTPYSNSIWQSLLLVQAEKNGMLLQNTIAPQVLSVATDPTATADATFSLLPANFIDGPYLDPIPGMTITPTALLGLVGCSFAFQTWSSTNTYAVGDYVTYSGQTYRSLVDLNTNLQPGTSTTAWVSVVSTEPLGANGLQNTDIGRHIRIFSEPPDWVATTTYGAGGTNQVKYNNAYWTSLVASNVGIQPGTDATTWAINPANAVWTWGKITSLTGATTSMIAGATGTAMGTFNADGSANTNCFDGTTVRNSGGGVSAATPGYIGKDFHVSGAQAIAYVLFYSYSVLGVTNTGAPVILNLRAKHTAPANSADGTLLGSTGQLDNFLTGPVQIVSNDESTLWEYVWVEVTLPPTRSSNTFSCAQVQFFNVAATVGTGCTIQLYGPPLLYTTAASIWRLGAFSSALGYPTNGTYHEGRLWLGGYVSNRIDAGALLDLNGNPPDSKFCFSPTLISGTVTDSCAISYTLDGPDVNAIFWMQPDLQGIIIGTQAGEWLAQASTLNSPLSPLNMQAHRVTKIGCANIEPRRTEHTNVFVQKNTHKVIEYFADIFSGKFTAPNLTEKAAHLGDRGIAELAYQQNLAPIIWARCNDGSLIGATYKRDTLMTSQGPTFIGWHRHTLGSGRTVESITVGPSPGNAKDAAGTLDTLAMVTSDGTYRQVEFLTNIFDETRLPSDTWFVDSGIIGVTTQGVTSGGNLGMLISGLWPLNGNTCTVVCGGYDCGDFAVANGQTFVPYTNVSTGIFTQVFATAAPQTIVGFTYNSDGQLVRPNNQQDAMTRSGTAFGRMGRIAEFAAKLVNAQAISFGTDFCKLDPAAFTDAAGNPFAANLLFSGTYWSNSVQDDSSRDGSKLCWRISRPYPATVAAISGSFQAEG